MIAYTILYLVFAALRVEEFSFNAYLRGFQSNWALRLMGLELIAAAFLAVMSLR